MAGEPSSWVTPKSIIKKRKKRKTIDPINSTFEFKSDTPTRTQSGIGNVEKFNPFKGKSNTNANNDKPKQSTIGLGINFNKKIDQSSNEFLDALGETARIAPGLAAKTCSETAEDKLRLRLKRGAADRIKDRSIPQPDDDEARDGFIPQNNIQKFGVPPLDVSIKSSIKIKLRDLSGFKRIKAVDWARAMTHLPPESDIQKLTKSCIYHIWPTKLSDSVYPRFGKEINAPLGRNYEAEWVEFNQTLSSIFSAIKYRLHNYFYLFAQNFNLFIFRSTQNTEGNYDSFI